MKKAFLWMMAVALLASCAKEKDSNIVTPTGGKTYTITANINNPETRTTAERFQDTSTGAYKYAFKWETGEKISVVPTDYTENLFFDLVDANTGTFSYTPMGGEAPNDYSNGFSMAVSPAEALISLTPSVTNYDIYFHGSYHYGHSNAILVAGEPTPGPDGTQKFQFEHIAALVKVTYKNVPAGTTAMVFEADHNIKGTFHFTSVENVVASNTSFSEVEEESPTEAVVMFDNALTFPMESAEFFLPIPTGSYQTFQVHLVGEDMTTPIPGTEQSWTAANPFTLNCADVVACPEITLPEITGDKYVKVTSNLEDYTGDYLIVSGPHLNNDLDDEYLAFNGGLSDLDVVNNCLVVDVVNGAVSFSEMTYGLQFHIDKIGDSGNYSIQSRSGKYIGVSTNSNGLKTSDNVAFPHAISINGDEEAVIAAVFDGSTMTMRYNYASNQNRFRYYKEGQKPISLYKLNGKLDVSFPTLTADDVTIAADKTEAVVTFSTNQNWTVTATSDLLDQNINASGTKDDTQSVTLNFKTTNGTLEDKTVTVHIVAGALTKDVTVTQKGIVSSISVDPTSATVAASATSSSFMVASNFAWDIISITVNGEDAPTGYSANVDAANAAKVNVSFPSNIAETTTNTRSIVVTVGDEDIKTASFTITQEGNVIQGGDDEVVDVITRATTGVTGSGYVEWSGKQVSSDAIYAGNSAGSNSSIQLRTTNSNSGVVSTTSGGKVKSISVVWNSNTTSDRTIDIYGSNTPYESASDLYNSSTRGTKLGSITYNSSEPLTITGDYKYIGIKSASGALYLTQISITWDTSSGEGGDDDDFSYTLSPVKNGSNSAYASTYDVTINGMNWNAPGNQNIDGEWRIGGNSISSVERVIYAKSAMAGDVNSVVVSTNGISRSEVTVNSITVSAHSTAALAKSGNDANAIAFSTDDSYVFETNVAKSLSFTKVGNTTCEGKFFRIVFNVTVTGTKNGGLNLTGIDFTE